MTERAMPIHKQIYRDLLEQIQAGQLHPGDVLPTEKELQERYGVSRAPVRQALGKLEAEGYIQRTPGRGTVVAERKHFPQIYLSGFAHYYNLRIDRLTSRTLHVQTLPADDEVAAHLQLAPGTPVLKAVRARLVDDVVTACMHNFFALPEFGAGLPDMESEFFTLNQFIKKNLNREEVDVQEDLVATLPPPEVAQLMGVEQSMPVLFVTRRGWDSDRRPVEISRYWTRTDLTTYRTFLTATRREG